MASEKLLARFDLTSKHFVKFRCFFLEDAILVFFLG